MIDIQKNEHVVLDEIIQTLNNGHVLYKRALVTNIPKVGKIHVYADHNPPHFHIVTPDYDVSVCIDTCELIQGGKNLNSKQVRDLQNWYFKFWGKNQVIGIWNKHNPNNQI